MSFTFQGTGAVPSPDTLVVTQIGSSPFNLLTWSRNVTPDGWIIRRDEQIIYSAVASDPQFVFDLTIGADGAWTWRDFTATGGQLHHYRVSAKVGGQTSDRDPSYDILTSPTGIWLGDPYRRTTVLLRGTDPGQFTQSEVSAVYYPLRGVDAVRVTQSQRGYEGTLNGYIRGPSHPSLASEGTATDNFRALQQIRDNAGLNYIIALPNLAFYATLSNITAAPADDVQQRWDVSLTFEQQGVSLWRASATSIPSGSVLLGSYDYEEGTNGAAVTTASPGVISTLGTVPGPTYSTAAAVHGVMGWNSPNAVTGGNISYVCPYVGMASVYLTPRTAHGGSGPSSILRLNPAGLGSVATVNLRTAGNIDISNSAGVAQVVSASTDWDQNKTIRLDAQWTWSTGTITVIVRIYSSPESSYPADEFRATFAVSNAPGELQVGSGNANMSLDIDSVRIYSGNATWADPEVPGSAAQPRWAIPGVPTQTTQTVASSVLSVSTINLAYSTTLAGNDPATPTYVGTQAVDANGLVRHTISGLVAGTTYYAKLSTGTGVFVGDLIQWRQLPASSGAFSVKVAVGSCQQNPPGSRTQLAWTDAMAWAPDQTWHLGDFGYWGGSFATGDDWRTHVGKYTNSLTQGAGMRQQLQRAGLLLLCDDHEFSSNNGDSKEGSTLTNPTTGVIEYTGKNRADNIQAMQNAFAMYPLADGAATKRGLYGSFMLGSKVRVIVLDGETLDRSLGSDTDSGTVAAPYQTIPKTYGGSPQDAWLRTVLVQPAAVNLIVCGKALLGTTAAAPDVQNADKPFNYGKWRQTLNSWIGANVQTGGSLPIKVCWIGGDRHANGYITGASNLVTPGHPSILASGYEQHGLPVLPGENWTASYGYDATKALTRVQYVQLTVADNGTNLITLTYLSREVHGVRTVADGVTTNGSKTVTSATAAFTASDVGMTITGSGLSDAGTIVTVNTGSSVTVSVAATATATGVTLTMQTNPSTWAMVNGATTSFTWAY